MFLWNGQKLGNARHKIFAVDEIPASEKMLADKKGQDVCEVGEKRDLMEGQICD